MNVSQVSFRIWKRSQPIANKACRYVQLGLELYTVYLRVHVPLSFSKFRSTQESVRTDRFISHGFRFLMAFLLLSMAAGSYVGWNVLSFFFSGATILLNTGNEVWTLATQSEEFSKLYLNEEGFWNAFRGWRRDGSFQLAGSSYGLYWVSHLAVEGTNLNFKSHIRLFGTTVLFPGAPCLFGSIRKDDDTLLVVDCFISC